MYLPCLAITNKISNHTISNHMQKIMLNKISLLISAMLIVSSSAVYPQDQYNLVTPHFKSGTVIKINIDAHATDGVLIQRSGDEEKRASMSVSKNYSLERTTLKNNNNIETEIHYNIIRVITNTQILFKGEKIPKATLIDLSDIEVVGIKDSSDNWQFSIINDEHNKDVEDLVSELEAYENRKWFSKHPVKIGDSWKIYPAFTNFIMSRDLQKVDTEGTMTLLDVGDKGENKIATLKFSATSNGVDESPEKGLRKASSDTQGLLQYSINQQLDTNLVITSQLESSVRQGDTYISVLLPFTYKVKKSIMQAH